MEKKKTSGAYLENKKTIMYMIGFVMVLSLAYIALEWSKSKVEVFKPIVSADVTEDLIVEIPQTNVNPPPPPPPPVQLIDEIKVVDDNIAVKKVEFKSDFNKDEVVPSPPIAYGDVPIEDMPDVPVVFAEKMPQFNGNVNEYLSKNIRYPQIAIETYTQGRVICQFVVGKDGSIEDIEIVRSVDPSLDKEALRVIKSMPKWKPGMQNGKPVKVRMTLPVNFRLM
jgi:protein TonB